MKHAHTHIIGIGQPAAGDDYAGIAVARALREHPLPTGVRIYEITDPARLIELLDGVRRAILIDAVVSDTPPGNILCLTPEDLAAYPATPLSTHQTSVAEAIGLAHALAPASLDCDLHIIGITIEPPGLYTSTMSTQLTAAVPRAACQIIDLLEENKTLNCA